MKASDFFYQDVRSDGSPFWRSVDDRPEWVLDAVYRAHDEETPDDWVWSACASAASYWDEMADYGTACDSFDFADRMTDVYTSDLLRWLGGDLSRLSAVDRVWDDMGRDMEPSAAIRAAQFQQLEYIGGIMFAAFDTNLGSSE